MKTMDDATEFFKAFLDAEYEGYKAMLMEPDEDKFYEKQLAVDDYGAIAGLSSNIARFEDDPLPSKEKVEYELKNNYVRRKLLKIERYTEDNRTLFVAYTTAHYSVHGTGTPEAAIKQRYIAEVINNRFVISRQQQIVEGKADEWTNGIGKEIEPSGEPDEVMTFGDEEQSV